MNKRWFARCLGCLSIMAIESEGRPPPQTRCSACTSQIADLERFLLGIRPDLDTLTSMANICDRFLAKLSDLPACGDTTCTQAACVENRNLRDAITAFKGRLYTPRTKGASHVSP